ncbi:MAG: sle [Aeromicrobium sp.]|nr:sle [Aeromicrobium sp.]
MSIASRRLAGGKTVYDVRLRAPDGSAYKRTFPTKREALLFEAEERSAKARGGWVDPRAGRLALEEYAARWMRDRVNLRTRTKEFYEGLLRLHILPGLGKADLADITPSMVRSWHADLIRSGKTGRPTVAKAYRLLRTVMNTAVEDGLIGRNPCVVRHAAVEHSAERPVATVEEVFALADASGARHRSLVLVATFTGLRLGELLALTRADVDTKAMTITVTRQLHQLKHGELEFGPPKSQAGIRVVRLPKMLREELEHHLRTYVRPGADAFVFGGEKGGSLRRHVWQKAWDRARRETGMEHLRFHDLRHTGNTLAATSGASTKELMARLGHSSPQAALRYQHATEERDEAIAAHLDQVISQTRRTRSRAMDVPLPGFDL